jgi:hypothetical protein
MIAIAFLNQKGGGGKTTLAMQFRLSGSPAFAYWPWGSVEPEAPFRSRGSEAVSTRLFPHFHILFQRLLFMRLCYKERRISSRSTPLCRLTNRRMVLSVPIRIGLWSGMDAKNERHAT